MRRKREIRQQHLSERRLQDPKEGGRSQQDQMVIVMQILLEKPNTVERKEVVASLPDHLHYQCIQALERRRSVNRSTRALPLFISLTNAGTKPAETRPLG
jgi:hypothetical protein